MKFPVTIEHRGQRAKIYQPGKNFPHYRVAFKVAGKRRMLTFGKYAEAKAAADAKVRALDRGELTSSLTAKESQDALAIRQALEAFRRDTGRKVSALEAVSNYLEGAKQLPKGSTVLEACRAYARSLGSVKPKAIAEAVAEFVASRKGAPKPGERARFNPVYAHNVESWLSGFSDSLRGHLVSDLCPEFFELHLAQFNELSAKTRNDRRAALGMWLRWCGRKEYIEERHLAKLVACDALQKELLPDANIEFYTPEELRKMLEASSGALRAVTALQALGGARLQEALRLRWADLYRTPGHIEISGQNAKTRKRRLLEVGPALAQWLAPFKGRTGPLWDGTLDGHVAAAADVRESVGVPPKRNGLRHGFVSFSYILRGEIETSALAGTSPTILHANYRGLATRAEAERWFNVAPAPVASNVFPLAQAIA